jgi:ketosteroid isomerase-like protein
MTMGLHETMAAINRAWCEDRPSEMYPYLHPDVTMVLPDCCDSITGRDAILGSFGEFCASARVLAYTQSEERIDVVGNVAFVRYRFDLLYERASSRQRSTGRDLWAFERVGWTWVAVWRAMLDVRDDPLVDT